jgi:hypothetical protein
VNSTLPDPATCSTPDSTKTQVVVSRMSYDAHAGSGATQRTIFYQDRLRNFGGTT